MYLGTFEGVEVGTTCGTHSSCDGILIVVGGEFRASV